MGILLILLAIPAVFPAWCVVCNGLITSPNGCRNAFARIDVQLRRRFDLIPDLVETAKGYLSHESETLEPVVAARGVAARSAAQSGLAAAKAHPGDPGGMARLAAVQGSLNAGLGRPLAVAEAHPDLKSNRNMMRLTEALATTKVAFARQAFSDAVMAFTDKRKVFPSSLIAGVFGFASATQLAIPGDRAEVREAPKVQV